MANKKIMDDLNGQLLKAVARGNASAYQHLIEDGANVHVVDEQGWSLLHQVAWYGHTDICQHLLKHGANVHALDNDGWSALHLAAYIGHADICLMLLAHDCDPLVKNKGNQTAREVAIDAGHEGCAHAIDAWVGAQAARAALREIAVSTSLKATAL